MTSQNLKDFQKKHKLTDTTLAKLLGVTVPAVHHWINERRRIPTMAAKLINFWDNYPQTMEYFK